MENYNWIKAVAISNGKQVEVRQQEKGGRIWIDKEGTIYTISDLDFTQAPVPDFIKSFEESNKRFAEQQVEHQELMNKMLSSLDANAIADHKAKIDEREYWRKLRGDIFLTMIEGYDVGIIEINTKLTHTKYIFNELYEQDKEFFKDK